MPIYEYRCEACGNRFEKLVRNPDDTPDACPECKESSLKKLFSSFAPQNGATATPCPAQAQCPSGTCCPGGSCEF